MKDLKRFVDRNIAPLLLLCFCGIMGGVPFGSDKFVFLREKRP